MAQRTQVILTDDLDNSEATQTVGFGLEGQHYEIDLNDDNAKELRDSFARYVSAARKVSTGGRRTAVTGRRSGTDVDPKAVRAWAQANKIELSPRGRIPASVVEQFRAAGN